MKSLQAFKKNWAYWLPGLLFVVLCGFLWRGLSLHPQELPSTLLNKAAPDFRLVDLLTTKTVDQSVFKGHVTLLNVWASWCETCVEEQAFLIGLKARYPQLQLLGMAFQDNKTHAVAWLKQYGNPYQQVLLDSFGKTGVDYGVYGTPESFLIDEQGIIRVKVTGVLNEQTWAPVAAYLKG